LYAETRKEAIPYPCKQRFDDSPFLPLKLRDFLIPQRSQTSAGIELSDVRENLVFKSREFLKNTVFWGEILGNLGGNPYFQFKNEGEKVGLYRLGKMGKRKPGKKVANLRKFS